MNQKEREKHLLEIIKNTSVINEEEKQTQKMLYKLCKPNVQYVLHVLYNIVSFQNASIKAIENNDKTTQEISNKYISKYYNKIDVMLDYSNIDIPIYRLIVFYKEHIIQEHMLSYQP